MLIKSVPVSFRSRIMPKRALSLGVGVVSFDELVIVNEFNSQFSILIPYLTTIWLLEAFF